MSTVQTQRVAAAPNHAVLAHLAERWRPAGVYVACFRPDGTLLWHDPHMPRLMSLALSAAQVVRAPVDELRQDNEPAALSVNSPVGGLELQLWPVIRRRRLTAWIAVLARTQALTATEELHRAAAQAQLDVTALISAAQRAPQLPQSTIPTLAGLVGQMYDDLQATSTRQQEISSVTEQLSSVYEEINLLYKISSLMGFNQKPQSFLEAVCGEMQEIGNFGAVAVALASRENESAVPVISDIAIQVGHCPLQGHELINVLFAAIQESLVSGEPQIQNDISIAGDGARLQGIMQRFACVPLMRDKRALGVLLAIDKNDSTDFSSVDLKLLNNVASQCSIFLENATLYQDMQDLFMGVLHALTRSIDAKDAYTRGHSQRVAELSRALARKIGLPESQCERVYLSGLLHDVGKIGVPEAVLTKPGRLTDAEFEAIKKHPAIGAQILGNIKQLQDILPGVLYHHERWDGRGYPYNLSAEGIPLIGRIICVADSFDAMSSTRTYRPALPLDNVLAEIQRCAGSQFDPALAKVFVTLDFGPYRQSVEEQLAAIRHASGTAAPLTESSAPTGVTPLPVTAKPTGAAS